MKKLLNLIFVEEYQRDMSKEAKFYRDSKLAILLFVVLMMSIVAFAPTYAESIPKSKKFSLEQTWICPNKSCKYDNYDEIRYCGLCGTEKGKI